MGTLAKGYSFGVEDNVGPVAIITPASQESVVGAIVKMDGRASYDADGKPSGVITYRWTFSRVPIGSQIEQIGFEPMDPESSVVTFAPDVTGFYEVSLVINDGSIDSRPSIGSVDVSIISVPNNRGIIPDASFIWNYLSDFWTLVQDRERFEVLWSAAIQIIGAELLKLYQYDYNKSIKDIQKVFQRRWIHYDPVLELTSYEVTGVLTDDQAGLDAATLAIDPDSGIVLEDQESFFNLVTVPLSEGNFVQTPYGKSIPSGLLATVADRSYTMARAKSAIKAINEGDDGSINVAEPNTFYGSGFYDNYVGLTLKILTGNDVGNYKIATVAIDGNRITVTDMSGGAVVFTTTASSLEYSVVPASDNLSSFFSDLKAIPTRTAGQAWRFGSTLQSTEYNFEEYGVSIGDVLEINVYRTDRSLSATLRVQVIGVDRNRLSFVFNMDDLTDGSVAGGLSDDTQLALAEALRVTGLVRNSAGNLEYSLEAEVVRSKLTSNSFKRNYYEITLNPEMEIDLGAFNVKLTPTKVIRNSKILLPSEILSIPMMQEYIKQPNLGEVDGQLYIIGRNGLLHEIDHEPYVLSENLDYVLDDESTITGFANTVQNFDEVSIPRGDLIDRGIKRGDTLNLVTGGTSVNFNIRKVIDSETLSVYPSPTSTAIGVQFTIERRVAGKFIRFVSGTFTKDNLIPNRLWAEVTFVSNNPLIEANFGSLVGVREEDLASAQSPYKSVVEGLMYALANGPVVQNLHLAAQILLGLPFAEESGVVTEINPIFRVRNDGSPMFGRILIEARDKDNNPTGVTNIYLYPQGRQLVDRDNPGEWIQATPNEAGLAINPDTGVEYVVGDSVSQFSVLSKGVDIDDYLTGTGLTESLLEQGIISALVTQYHSFRLRINSDITTPADVNLTTNFIKTAKPHYAHISAGLLKIVEDFIDIDDALLFGLVHGFFDTIGYSLPVAVKVDRGSGDDDYLSIDGIMYTRYVYGADLVTTQGSNQVTSASGGFVSPGPNQTFDRPLIRSGDVLNIESGPNMGPYPISTVDGNTNVTVTFAGQFETKSDQKFRIYRPVTNPIFPQFTANVIQTSQLVSIPEGGMSAGIAVGDVFAFHGGAVNASRIYTIIAFDRDTKKITVSPAIVEASGSYTGNIRREGIETRYLGKAESDTPFTADFNTGSAAVVFQSGSSDLNHLSFIRPGDTIIRGVQVFNVLDFKPTSLTAYVDPKPTFTAAGESVKLWRPTRQGTPIAFDFTDRIPDEYLGLDVKRTSGGGVLLADLQTTATSPDVDTSSIEDFDALGIVPGDLLVLLDGADSNVDIGYGTGVYPIQELPDVNTLRLTRPLTTTGTFKYGVRRRKSL